MRLYVSGETPPYITKLSGFELENNLRTYPGVVVVRHTADTRLDEADGLVVQFTGPDMASEHRVEAGFRAGKNVLAMVYQGYGAPHQILRHLDFPMYGGIVEPDRRSNVLSLTDEASGGTIRVVHPYRSPGVLLQTWMWTRYGLAPATDYDTWTQEEAVQSAAEAADKI